MAGFSVTISAVDKLTGTLDRINKKTEAFGAPFKKMQGSLTKFGEVSGLNRVSKSFSDIAYNARGAFGQISEVVAPLGAISSAASVAGMYRMIAAWSDWGSKLSFAAQNMNITAGALSNFQGAARLAGSSSASLTNGMQTLGQTMFDAIGGRAPEAVVMFNTLHVNFHKTATSARSVADVMPEVADSIAGIRDPFVQAKIATELFGSAGADLLPFLRKGSAGMREYEQSAQRYLDVTPASTSAANEFREAQTRLTLSVEGLGNSIATKLSPILSPLLTNMANWISSNRDLIATDIAHYAQELATWLKSINWTEIGTELHDWGNAAASVASAFGGIKTGLEAVAGFMAASFAVKILGPWVKLASLIVRATGGLGVIGRIAGTAYLGNKIVNAVDPKDATGSWIDRNIPGASYVDNLASKVGLGRSYAQQGLGGGSSRPSSADQSKAAQEATAYFVSQGWTPAQAAGMAANIQQESGFNAGAVGDNGAAHGLGQWHEDRMKAIEQHFGKSMSDMSVRDQEAAYSWELRSGGEQAAGRRLAMAQTAGEAGGIVSQYDERPGDVAGERNRRGALADQIARLYASTVTPTGPAMQAPGTGSSAMASNDGSVTLRLQHANQPPDGFRASITGSDGSMSGARVAQSNVTSTLA